MSTALVPQARSCTSTGDFQNRYPGRERRGLTGGSYDYRDGGGFSGGFRGRGG